FVPDDRLFPLSRRREASHVLQSPLELTSGQSLRKIHGKPIRPKNEPSPNAEHQHSENHQRTSVTPSNMFAGKWMPDALSRSPHLGRTPVARKRPSTLPSWLTPIFSQRKLSCIGMMSPFIPVVSL